jgi:signal transduction histidine kinase
VLCVPVQLRGHTEGVIYLEQSATPHAFTTDRLEIVQHLAAQLAISLENAQLLRRMRDAVRARDEFLMLAAHELRTPLTPLHIQVTAALRALRTDDPKDAKRAAPLATAKRQLDRLAELVDHLLDISSVTSGGITLRREPTNLVDVVRGAIARLEPNLAQAGCTVNVRAPSPVVGTWDRNRLEQVAGHLLSNASKFGAGRPIDVTVDESNGVARLSVRDHGMGIAPEDQERVFRPFERAVSALHFGGFGVGLWLAEEIVEAHGGAIRVDSQPGLGARFIVELPTTHP